MPGPFGGLRLILLVAALALGGWAAARGAEPSTDALTEAFVQIVETAEYGNRPRGVAKWNREVGVAVVGQPEPDQAATLDALLERLRRVPNLALTRLGPVARPPSGGDPAQRLDFTRADGIFQFFMHLPGNDWTVYTIHGLRSDVFVWRAHLTLLFAPQAVFAHLARLQRFDPRLIARIDAGHVPCAANFYVDPANHEIRYATIVLRTDVPEWMRRRCLHEEVIQALGLANDIKDSDITLFDDAPARRRTEPTPHDWMFLDILYDPRMTPGLAGRALRDRARQLIAERRSAGSR